MCETRWVERHTNMEDFVKMLIPIIMTLESISSNIDRIWDTKSITEAQGLLSNIQSSGFIAAFSTHYHLMGYTKQLSINLQGTKEMVVMSFSCCSCCLKIE